ncbi:hypothetical protein BHE74_00040204 [Ensete ventricosum]|nr:hypothetical protein BHE74_00040204 [Ensete ventricosum]
MPRDHASAVPPNAGRPPPPSAASAQKHQESLMEAAEEANCTSKAMRLLLPMGLPGPAMRKLCLVLYCR